MCVCASLAEASPLDNTDFRLQRFSNSLHTFIKSRFITQSATKTNMSVVGRHVWPSYSVEELFKLLHEQLHSAGLHCSAERAVEELRRNGTQLQKRFICMTEASGSEVMEQNYDTFTHLIHAVALPSNSTINSVLSRK